MNYLAVLASLNVGCLIFSMKMVTKYYKNNQKLFNISLAITILSFILSRILIILAMKNTNPVFVHIILNFSIFITLILSLIFIKDSFKNIKLKQFILGLIIFIIGLIIIQLSLNKN